MGSLNSVIHKLSSKYASKGMNIKQAMDVWKAEKLSSEQIQGQILYDVNEKISVEDANIIHAASYNKEVVQLEYDLYNKLQNAKYIKVTPTIKSALEKVGGNRYKIAGVDISWTIELKEGKPWLKRISNKSLEGTQEESLKISNEGNRTKTAAVEENEPWEIYYWNSGLADRFLEEYPGNLPEELRCIFKDLEGLQQGMIREADFLLRVLDIAEEHKDIIKSLRDKAEEEFDKRKHLRDLYEKGDKPEYYRGASVDSTIKVGKFKKEKEDYDADDVEHEDDIDLDLLD